MLKYYIPTTEVCINSIKPFHINLYARKICESHPNENIIKVNWDNAEEEILKIKNVYPILPFEIIKKRKGLKLFFWNNLFFNVKQWKEDLNIEITTTWKEYQPSIKMLMNFYDSDKAIQYLAERGLNTSSLIK
jgi:hypothetical protein|nr:MAG TPA: hypothetical protein [Caudoviricetes sp.]DAS43530.1 MAG TPA: hypothetical protein [Caudoviricetes sp.]